MSEHLAFNPYLPSYEYVPDGEPLHCTFSMRARAAWISWNSRSNKGEGA